MCRFDSMLAAVAVDETTDSIFTSDLNDSIWHTHKQWRTSCEWKEQSHRIQCVRWFYCVLFSCYLHPFHLFIFCSVSQTHNILCTLCKYKRLNRNAFRISHRISESVIILYSIWIRTDLFVHHIFIHIFVSCRKIHTHSHILGGKKSQLKHISLVQSGKKRVRLYRMFAMNAESWTIECRKK